MSAACWLSRNGLVLNSMRGESMCVLTMRMPLSMGSAPITNSTIVRSRLIAYQRVPGLTAPGAGFDSHLRKPLASATRVASRTNAISDFALPRNALKSSAYFMTASRSCGVSSGHALANPTSCAQQQTAADTSPTRTKRIAALIRTSESRAQPSIAKTTLLVAERLTRLFHRHQLAVRILDERKRRRHTLAVAVVDERQRITR